MKPPRTVSQAKALAGRTFERDGEQRYVCQIESAYRMIIGRPWYRVRWRPAGSTGHGYVVACDMTISN